MALTRSLAILHVLRAPVGGLFRHVQDLAVAQAALGHQVGIVADRTTGGPVAREAFARLGPHLALGLTRVPMSRDLGWSDVAAMRHVSARARDVDVIHGHGAKGGAYARLAYGTDAVRVYTPHGGSLHYSRSSPVGFVYLGLERLLARRTDVFLFESAYGRDTFAAKIGAPHGIVDVVHNGLRPDEFALVAPEADASDVVFVGELRKLKGVDVLIEALRLLRNAGRRLSATIIGAGPDAAAFRREAAGLGGLVRFPGPLPAREAFARGRILVVPSRAESLPYVVLEAAAAGLPVIATRVGGMAEIFGPQEPALVPAQDSAALAAAIVRLIEDPAKAKAGAHDLRLRVAAHFTVAGMTKQVIAAYAEALGAHDAARP